MAALQNHHNSQQANCKILLIDDDEEDFLLTRHMLREAKGRELTLHWAANFEDGLRMLVNEQYSAALVDYDLGKRSGIDLIRAACEHGCTYPLILFTGRGSFDVDLEAMQAGATLYITKNEASPLMLERAIRYAIELKNKEQALLSREAALQETTEALRRSEAKFAKSFRGSPVAIAISTVADGRFMEVNDSYLALFEYTRDEMIGRTSVELGMFPDPAERAKVRDAFRSGNGFKDYELRLFTKSRKTKDVLFSTEPIEIDGQDCMLSIVVDITERKEAEVSLRASQEALRQNEERLREFLETTHDSFFILDRDWRFLFINRRAAELLGHPPEELIGKAYWETFPKYIGTEAEKHYRRAMEERVPVHFSHAGVYTDSYYEVSIYPTRDGIAVSGANRTEEKKAQEALRQLSEAVKQSPATVVITDLNGQIEYVNPKFTQLTGYTFEEAKGKKPNILQSGQTPRSIYRELWKKILGGETWRGEFANRKKNGEIYWESVSISPITNDFGSITHFVAVKEDVTERKKAEEALREAHNNALWMARFPDENPSPVARVSYDGAILYRNPVANLLPGWELEVGQLLQEPLLSLLRRSTVMKKEVREDMLLGDRFYGISVMPFPEERYANLYGRDITERVQAEDTLVDLAQRLERSNRELEQFAFVASHDLQEPLRKIRMFSDSLMKQKDPLPDISKDYLDRMSKAAERMQQMIDGLLELSRVHTRKRAFSPVSLNRLAEEALSDLEARVQVTGGQVHIGDLPSVEADAMQMRQLFQNMIGNALKFHKQGLQPVIHVTGTTSSHSGPPMATIQIADNGIGFDPQYAERIFQPFQRLNGKGEYEGTGLGLAIVHKIVERHKGKITVQSAPGEGTTFTIELPVKAG